MPFAPSPKQAKSPNNAPATSQRWSVRSFDDGDFDEATQSDVGTQLSRATQFGHSLGGSQPTIQREAIPEEEEEVQMKPQLQRETMPEEAEELQRQPEEEELQAKAIQPKLTIGQPGDKYEQEADSMAAKVMAMPDSAVQREAMPEEEDELQMRPQLQRQTIPEEEDETLQAKPQIQANGTAPEAPANFDNQLAQHKGSGQPLPDETRAFMEPRFGADFSNVRVHETPDLANAIQAQAFTHGQDIYFNSGKYNPGSSGGKELLAHELTHVVQQREEISLQSETSGGLKSQKQTQAQKTQERLWYEQNPSPKVQASDDLLVLWNFPINMALVRPVHKKAIRNFVKNRNDLFWLKSRSFHVIGRASVSGSDELNLSLSERRAQAVEETLLNTLSNIEGVNVSNHRIHAFGQGSTEISALRNSPIGSAMSRRVDIKIGKPSYSSRSPVQSEQPEASPERKKNSRNFRFRPFISAGIASFGAIDYLIFEIFDLTNKRTALFHYLGVGAGLSVGVRRLPIPSIGTSMAGSWKSFKTLKPIGLEDFEGKAEHASIGLQVGVGPTFESLYLRNPVNFGASAIELNWGGWWEVGGANAGGLMTSGKAWIETVAEDISSTHAKNQSSK